MPLGDSITAGGELFHSYRGPLARMLERSGFPCAGSAPNLRRRTSHNFTMKVIQGNRSNILPSNMRRIYSANPADIILLHAGHNHTVEEHPVRGIVKSTEQIIRMHQRDQSASRHPVGASDSEWQVAEVRVYPRSQPAISGTPTRI